MTITKGFNLKVPEGLHTHACPSLIGAILQEFAGEGRSATSAAKTAMQQAGETK